MSAASAADGVERLIFDCDGVLTDSQRVAVRVDVPALEDLGAPLSKSEVITRFMSRFVAGTRGGIEYHLGRVLAEGPHEHLRCTLGLTGLDDRVRGSAPLAGPDAAGSDDRRTVPTPIDRWCIA